MGRLSRRATQATRGRGAEIMQQARQRHVSGNALIERGCWMTSVSVDPLVIHATARLAVVGFMQRRDRAKGTIMGRFSRRATQAIRGRLISAASCTGRGVEGSRNWR